MSLAQFLGNVGAALAPQMIGTPGINPESPSPWSISPDAGPMRIPGAQPVRNAPEPQQQPRRKNGGLRDFLGNLGDVLLAANGADAIYQPRKQERELGDAMAAYLGSFDPALADLARQNPRAAAEMFKGFREDRRFDRTAGQDDRRIGVAEGQLGLGNRELDERVRANKAGEAITVRGQDTQAGTSVTIQKMRDQQAQLDRQFEAAMAQGDHERAKELLGLKNQYDIQIAMLGNGGDDAAVGEYVMETPGTEAVPAQNNWLLPNVEGKPAQPSTKTKIKVYAAPASPSQAVRGRVYSTPQGPKMWTGTGFVDPSGQQ